VAALREMSRASWRCRARATWRFERRRKSQLDSPQPCSDAPVDFRLACNGTNESNAGLYMIGIHCIACSLLWQPTVAAAESVQLSWLHGNCAVCSLLCIDHASFIIHAINECTCTLPTIWASAYPCKGCLQHYLGL
jgi:hypothetical protein